MSQPITATPAPTSPVGRPLEIFLIEDNPGDVLLTREALRDAKVLNRLTVASNGEEALAMLRHEGIHANGIRPDLILLDLNLPRLSGLEVLAAIRTDPALATLPVVMLTSSAAEHDVGDSYALGVNCYVTKPVDIEQFLQVVRSVEQFWFTIVTLPGRP
jgi:chemotaxis family two-component system response regulator Rcp1